MAVAFQGDRHIIFYKGQDMDKQKLLYWIFAAFAVLFGAAATGYSLYLIVRGQGCDGSNDLNCSLGMISGFIILPFGLGGLLTIGVASMPFKVVRLTGSICAILFGFAGVGFCCITSLWAFSPDGASLLADDLPVFFLLGPFLIFLWGSALIGTGVMGYQISKK
jgi:hypothetical protein